MASLSTTALGRYVQYKKKQAVFITWLTETARKCCKLDDNIAALKGRAGKQDGATVHLTGREILVLCNKIVDKKKVTIPDKTFALLSSVIDLRKRVYAAYINNPATQGKELDRLNDGHAHFITVMQQAYKILNAVDASRITTSSNHAPPQPQSRAPRNMFESLDVEDTPELSLDEDVTSHTTNTPRINFQLEIKAEEELTIELCCMLEDIQDVREEIEETFKQHVRGEISMELAGLSANIGFGIIRRTWESFVAEHARFTDYHNIIEFLGLQMETHKTLIVLFPKHDLHKPAQQPTTLNIDASTSSGEDKRSPAPTSLEPDTAKLLCVSGAAIMKELCLALQTTGAHQANDPYAASRHPFAQVLHNGIHELRNFGLQTKLHVPKLGSWYGDEFLSAIFRHAFGDQKALSLCLAVMTQCYRNIHDILKGNMIGGAHVNMERFAEFKATVQSFEAFQYCAAPVSNIAPKPKWDNYFHWVKRPDNTDATMAEAMKNHRSGKLDQSGLPIYLIAHLPTIPTGMIFNSVCFHNGHGWTIINMHLVAHCAAHLYAACRSTGVTKEGFVWRDMEFLLKHYGLYTDRPPTSDPFILVSHFQLSVGVRGRSLADLKKNFSFPNGRLNPNNFDGIKSKAAVFDEYNRLLGISGNNGRDTEDVDRFDTMLQTLAEAHFLQSQQKAGVKSSKAKAMAFTPAQLLVIFKETYIRDEPQTRFNVIRFSQRCSTLMEAIRKQVSDVVQIDETLAPHHVANYILGMAARGLDAGVPASQTLLPLVAGINEKTITDCGDNLAAEALAKSSGSMSKENKPRYTSHSASNARVFDVLVRECLGPAQNWHFEHSHSGATISLPGGSLETFRTLTRLHDACEGWEHYMSWSLPEPQAIALVQKLIAEMRTWVKTGLTDKATPRTLVELLALAYYGKTDKESMRTACEWLRKAVRFPL